MAKAAPVEMFARVPVSLCLDSRLTATDRVVYLAIAAQAHGMGYIDCSAPAIMKYSGCSKSSVVRSVAALEAAGWLSVTRGRGYVNRHTFVSQTPTRLREHLLPVSQGNGRIPSQTPTSVPETTTQFFGEPETYDNREEERIEKRGDDPSSKVFAEPTVPLLPLARSIRDVYTYRDLMAGQIPVEVLSVPYVQRQCTAILDSENPQEFDNVEFYRDPSKLGGWGMRRG